MRDCRDADRHHARGIDLDYETIGSPADPPLLLVMGYGGQLIAWPRGFSEMLAAGGRFVIEFDNRDSGLSTKLDDARGRHGGGDRRRRGRRPRPRVAALAPYTLSDLADDCVALLDGLGIDRAHVLGASMGGMIAQQLAIEHPERLLSLVSMISNTGEPERRPADRGGARGAAQPRRRPSAPPT